MCIIYICTYDLGTHIYIYIYIYHVLHRHLGRRRACELPTATKLCARVCRTRWALQEERQAVVRWRQAGGLVLLRNCRLDLCPHLLLQRCVHLSGVGRYLLQVEPGLYCRARLICRALEINASGVDQMK